MNLKAFKQATVKQLIDEYRLSAAAHGDATEAGDDKTGNRHHDRVAAIYRELRGRGLVAQRALLPLLEEPHVSVRSWAATHALEFAPDEAEPVLSKISLRKGLVAFTAKMTLQVWRKGELSFP